MFKVKLIWGFKRHRSHSHLCSCIIYTELLEDMLKIMFVVRRRTPPSYRRSQTRASSSRRPPRSTTPSASEPRAPAAPRHATDGLSQDYWRRDATVQCTPSQPPLMKIYHQKQMHAPWTIRGLLAQFFDYARTTCRNTSVNGNMRCGLFMDYS